MLLHADLKSVFNCCKAAVKPMMRARGGRIINITSVVGLSGHGGPEQLCGCQGRRDWRLANHWPRKLARATLR